MPDPQIHIAPRKHFYAFDTMRFFAFLKVFLQHVPVFAFAWFNAVRAGGVIGVQFFFVLSGFLITYILLNDKKQEGTYNLRNFFVRRVLRIWPLFYLIVAISYAIPHLLQILHLPKAEASGYQPTWWVSLLFLENYKMIFTHSLPNVPELAVTWSLCIEEHFYITWGLLLWFLPLKAFPKVAGASIIIAFISRLIFYHYNLEPTDLFTNIDLFAFGSIPAYLLVFHEEKTRSVISRIPRLAHIIFICLVIGFVLATAQVRDIVINYIWQPTLCGIVFSLLIFLSMHAKDHKKRSPVNKAGTYTYGLYMYHVLVIVILARVFDHLHLSLDHAMNAVMFTAAALAGTLLFSTASYYVFEKPFLKLKRLFR